MNIENKPIVMAEEFWANSPLSIVRYYGQIKVYGCEYIICNKEGKDIYECSLKRKKRVGKKRSNPANLATLLGPTSFRFTANWAVKNSWNS